MELSIEEKAKRYDEAIKVAKSNYETIVQMDKDCTFAKEGIVNTFHHIFPELKESEDERIRKCLLSHFSRYREDEVFLNDILMKDIVSWLEKQGEKTNPYSGTSFEYNGHTWGMCARDNGVDILLDKQLFKHLEKQDEPVEINPTEFDTKLQALIGKFEGLPKEELIGSLSFWLNVVQNNGTYKPAKKQGEEKASYTTIVETGNGGINALVTRELSNSCDYEEKPVGKVKPKFKVGDWINCYYTNYKVLSVNNDRYAVEDVDGNKINILFKNEKFHHLFTIADANDGDVLATEPIEGYPSPFVAIYKKQNEKDFDSYCFIGFDGKFYKGENGHSTEEVHPATKEQRDQLEKAMADAEYTFDFEKKELRKIDPKHVEWSEEDKQMLNVIESDVLRTWQKCEVGTDERFIRSKVLNWLKSLNLRTLGSQVMSRWKCLKTLEKYCKLMIFIVNQTILCIILKS